MYAEEFQAIRDRARWDSDTDTQVFSDRDALISLVTELAWGYCKLSDHYAGFAVSHPYMQSEPIPRLVEISTFTHDITRGE